MGRMNQTHSKVIMNTIAVLIISCVVAAGYASADETCQEPWDTFEHTFNLGNLYHRVRNNSISEPRQIDDIDGDESCVNNIGTATVYGYRRQLQGDQANNLVGLYDTNGFIAGMQVRFNKTALYDGWTNTFRYDRVPMFQTETVGSVEYFVLTAYFVDPAIICAKGRTDLATGTGTTLLFQNGPTPDYLLSAPIRRPDALTQGYSNNKCFPGMGNHTFYNVESWQGNNCNEITPVFLLQNRQAEGCLVGFGLAWVGTSKSPLFEQPPEGAVKVIVGAELVPTCLLNLAKQKRLTTMHVFFTRKSQGCGGLFGTGFASSYFD